ncbi:recombinase family protein, partial [Enterovibrio nigricans]
MKGQRIGYIRVSSFDQNPNRQLDGIATDRAFIDKASGKSIDRPQLEEMLRFAREGDIIIVHSMDRLARNLDDLRTLVRNLTSKGIDIQFCKEQLTFTNNDSPMSQLLLSVMGAFAEFERALLGVVAKNSIGRISPRRFLKLRVNYLDIKESIH